MTAVFVEEVSTSTAARSRFRGRKAVDQKWAGAADSALRRAVLARLIAHPLGSTGQIWVGATAGEVTLSGYVTSNAQKDAAITAPRRVEGVEELVDDLGVAVPRPAEAGQPPQVQDARTAAPAIRTLGIFNTTPAKPASFLLAPAHDHRADRAADRAHVPIRRRGPDMTNSRHEDQGATASHSGSQPTRETRPKGQPLPKIEQIELEAHRGDIVRDGRRLVEIASPLPFRLTTS